MSMHTIVNCHIWHRQFHYGQHSNICSNCYFSNKNNQREINARLEHESMITLGNLPIVGLIRPFSDLLTIFHPTNHSGYIS